MFARPVAVELLTEVPLHAAQTQTERQKISHALTEEKIVLELTQIFVVAVRETIASSKDLKELRQGILIQREPDLILTLALTVGQEAEVPAIGLILLADHPITARLHAQAQAEAVVQATVEAPVDQVDQAVAPAEEVAAEVVLVAQVEVVLAEDDN